jgi:ribosomal protein S18 acetylase RimI-like enzyme
LATSVNHPSGANASHPTETSGLHPNRTGGSAGDPAGFAEARIRRLGVDDVDVLRHIRLRALRDAPEAFWGTYESEVDQKPEDWRRWLATAALFVAEDSDGTCGIAGGMAAPDNPAAAWLVSMWVAPERRGSGLADQLVAAVTAWAESEGRHRITLHVEEHNGRALRCYRRLGFALTGRRLHRPRDGAWELEMESRG